MTLADFSIRRPVFAWMLMAALMFFGALSFFRLGITEFPEATVPLLTIQAEWTGAAPELMESEIVNPIEEAVVSVQGLTDIEAIMRQGRATIKLTFRQNKDIDAALQETNSRLRSVRLPPDVLPPTILEVNTDDIPIMWLAVNSRTRPIKELVAYVDRDLKNRLQALPGVGHVVSGGFAERNLRVWVDNDKLLSHQLTVLDVENTLRMENEEVPSGYLENDSMQLDVRTMGEAITPEELGAVIIRQRGGVSIYHSNIRLRDVATIEDGLNDARSFARSDGVPTVGLGIQKQRGANEVATGAAIRTFVDDLNSALARTQPDLRVAICYDGTRFTSDAVRRTELTLVFSMIVTGLFCWAFLGSWPATFNVLISIPVSVLGTFMVMQLLGFTLNFLTLVALSLAVGLVVDDAIIVLENITRHFELGRSPARAASEGTREISSAATASTLAIIVVFLPALLLQGFVGTFLFQYGLTLSAAVALSLLEALTFTPMRCSRFMVPRGGESVHGAKVRRLFAAAADRYRGTLEFCLRHRAATVLISFALFGLSLASVAVIKKEFVPPMDIGLFLIQFQAPSGSSLSFADSKVRQLEAILQREPAINNYFVECGGEAGDNVTSGHAFVMLKPRSQRSESLHDVVSSVRAGVQTQIPGGLRTSVVDLAQDLSATKRSNTIELSVRGEDYAVLKEKVAQMTDRFSASGLMTDVDTDFRSGEPEIEVQPDREKAADSGVSMDQIAGVVHAAIGGVRQGKYTNGAQRYDVRMRLMPQQRESEDDMAKLLIRTDYGEMIPLSAVTRISHSAGLQTITREMRERSITIYANLATGASLDKAMDFARRTATEILPSGYHMVEVGASRDAIDAVGAFVFALGLGLVLSYMVLAAQFDSFIHPLPVFATLPFTLTGALIALLLTNHSLNIYSLMGLVLLMGIAKKNAILLVDACNRERRDRGLGKNEAILAGAPLRLRPILMTSAATVVAALPAGIDLGEGGEVRTSLAIVVIGGVVVSTCFSLLIVPCLYSLLAESEDRKSAIRHELDAIEAAT